MTGGGGMVQSAGRPCGPGGAIQQRPGGDRGLWLPGQGACGLWPPGWRSTSSSPAPPTSPPPSHLFCSDSESEPGPSEHLLIWRRPGPHCRHHSGGAWWWTLGGATISPSYYDGLPLCCHLMASEKRESDSELRPKTGGGVC